MPEYHTRALELLIKVFCRITLAIIIKYLALVRGTALHTMHYAYVVSKRRNFLSTDRVKKLLYLHGNFSNTPSYNRLTGASAKPGSSLLNYIRNKM